MVVRLCWPAALRAEIVRLSSNGEPARKTPLPLSRRKKTVREKDWRPEVHVVQKGDTLYSIAFNYGFDYHELAELNAIKDPSVFP